MSFRVLKAAHLLLLWPIESMGLAYLPTFNLTTKINWICLYYIYHRTHFTGNHQNQPNVGKYTIHGSYGWCFKYFFLGLMAKTKGKNTCLRSLWVWKHLWREVLSTRHFFLKTLQDGLLFFSSSTQQTNSSQPTLTNQPTPINSNQPPTQETQARAPNQPCRTWMISHWLKPYMHVRSWRRWEGNPSRVESLKSFSSVDPLRISGIKHGLGEKKAPLIFWHKIFTPGKGTAYEPKISPKLKRNIFFWKAPFLGVPAVNFPGCHCIDCEGFVC